MEEDKITPQSVLVQNGYDFDYYEGQESEDDDDLSLCDLPLGKDEENYVVSYSDHYKDPDDDAFEFSTTTSTTTESSSSSCSDHETDTVLFCGKPIPCRPKPPASLPQTTSFQSTQTHATSAKSLHVKAQSSRFHNVRTPPPTPTRSSSLRTLPETGNSRYQQGYSSSSTRSCSRVLISLTKFPPRMELSEMRKRQGRRASVPLSSAVDGGDQPVVAGGEKGHWSLLRPLRFKSNFLSALARVSFGCFRHV